MDLILAVGSRCLSSADTWQAAFIEGFTCIGFAYALFRDNKKSFSTIERIVIVSMAVAFYYNYALLYYVNSVW
jgi:hypothetical protein